MSGSISEKWMRASRWIYMGTVVWCIVLVFVTRNTAALRREIRQTASHPEAKENGGADRKERLQTLQEENERLRNDLKGLAELKRTEEDLLQASADRRKHELALWVGKSNALQAAIERRKQELAELRDWSKEWELAEQRKAAQAWLVEKASKPGVNPEKDYAQLKEKLRRLALARTRLMGLRTEYKQLDRSQQPGFMPRLREAQSEWAAASEQLGKDQVLYEGLRIENSQADPASTPLMRSVIPDLNGMSVTVYMDGTVNFFKGTTP